MNLSVDSISLVCPYPNLRDDYLEGLNFSKTRGKFGGWTWFDNGMREIHEPQLTFYRDWFRRFILRVDLNLPKLLHGSNLLLPTTDEIQDCLLLTTNNVSERTKLNFDAFKSQVCRIHYAANQSYQPEEDKQIFEYLDTLQIPRLKRNHTQYGTIYFMNGSRGIRIYDKNRQLIDTNSDPKLIENSLGIFRFEYFINNLATVKRFAKRLGFKDSTAQEMLLESNRAIVMNELNKLLGFSRLNHSGENCIQEIFEKTGNIQLAIKLSGFKDALAIYGDKLLKNNLMKKSTYYYLIRLCRQYGV